MAVGPASTRRLALILAALLLAACERSSAACPPDPAGTAAALLGLFTNGTLSPGTAGTLLGSQHSVDRHGGYWHLKSASCPMEIVMPAKDAPGLLEEAELRLGLEAGLRLRDLEGRFGAGETVYSSKRSSVQFRVPVASGGSILAFARLYTRTPTPDSGVLTLVLRRATENK
jgi:hypothetical protein